MSKSSRSKVFFQLLTSDFFLKSSLGQARTADLYIISVAL